MASCQQPPRGARALTPAEQADWTRDSLKYVTDSTKWVRDSLVRDSLARAVNTDSLYRLYRSMLHAPDPVRYMAAIDCERFRLWWRNGFIPGEAAIHRAESTVFAPGDKADADRMRLRLDRMTPEQNATLSVSPRKCGVTSAERRTVFEGTNLEADDPRPARPRRPVP